MRRFCIIILLVVASVATSCKSENDFEYTNAIPKDAAMVACVNVRTLLEKSGVGGSNEAKEQLEKTLASGCSTQLSGLIGDLLDDLDDNSGLDLTSPIYLASYGEVASEHMLVAKIGDKESFESVLGVLKSDGKCQGITSHGDYSSAVLGDGSFEVGYNESAAVVARKGADFAAMLSRQSSESINSVAAFEKMRGERCDVEFMFAWKPYVDAMGFDELGDDHVFNSLIMSALNFENVYSYGGINFEIGAVSLYSQLCCENEATTKLFENLLSIHKPINGRFNTLNDKSTHLMATIGVNGKELYSRIGDYMRTKCEERGLSSAHINIIANVVSSVNGDLCVSMTENGDVKGYAALTSADQGRRIVERVQDEVGFNFGYENSAYMGIKGDMFYLTTSFDEYQYIDEPFSPSMKDVEFRNSSDDNIIMCYVGADYITKTLSDCTETEFVGNHIKGMKLLNHIEMFVDKSGRAEINLVLKDKNANALRSIITKAAEL